MPDYTKAKIYRLTCDDPELIYYGSTTLELSTRLYNHKKLVKKCSSQKLFEVGGVEIELVLECPCESLQELREIEDTYISNDTCVNVRRAYLTAEETKIRFKEYKNSQKSKETQKRYRQTEKCKESYRQKRLRKKQN